MVFMFPFFIDLPEKRLHRRIREELTGRAPVSEKQLKALIKNTSVKQVNQVIREKMSLDQLVVIAVGHQDEIQKPLEQFSKVELLDVSAE